MKRITDSVILDWMNDGTVYLEMSKDIKVWKYHSSHRKYQQVSPNYGDPGRVRFVFGAKGFARRTVYRNKLVWLWVYRTTPSGRIDHIDGDSMNDQPNNLQEHTIEESNQQGNKFQQDERFREGITYFVLIARLGREPEKGELEAMVDHVSEDGSVF